MASGSTAVGCSLQPGVKPRSKHAHTLSLAFISLRAAAPRSEHVFLHRPAGSSLPSQQSARGLTDGLVGSQRFNYMSYAQTHSWLCRCSGNVPCNYLKLLTAARLCEDNGSQLVTILPLHSQIQRTA